MIGFIFKVFFIIVGTLIGAGFASGKEIYLFFFRYGKNGIISIAIASILFGIIIYKTLEIIRKNKINNYDEFLNMINPKYKSINYFINMTVKIFILICFWIMIAGFSGYIKQIYEVHIFFSSIFFVIICYFVLLKGIDGIIKISEILVPFLIIIIIYIGIKNINGISNYFYLFNKIDENKKMCLFSGLLYVSYNSITLVPVLITLKKYSISKKNNLIISIITVVTIFSMILLIFLLLLKGGKIIENKEILLMEILKNYGELFKYLYECIIIISIFTSAISEGYCFLKNVDQKRYNIILFIICFFGIFISNIGFSKLISFLYPLFGVLGLIQILFIIMKN